MQTPCATLWHKQVRLHRSLNEREMLRLVFSVFFHSNFLLQFTVFVYKIRASRQLSYSMLFIEKYFLIPAQIVLDPKHIFFARVVSEKYL